MKSNNVAKKKWNSFRILMLLIFSTQSEGVAINWRFYLKFTNSTISELLKINDTENEQWTSWRCHNFFECLIRMKFYMWKMLKFKAQKLLSCYTLEWILMWRIFFLQQTLSEIQFLYSCDRKNEIAHMMSRRYVRYLSNFRTQRDFILLSVWLFFHSQFSLDAHTCRYSMIFTHFMTFCGKEKNIENRNENKNKFLHLNGFEWKVKNMQFIGFFYEFADM